MDRRSLLRAGAAGALAISAGGGLAAPSFDRFRVTDWSARRRHLHGSFGRLAFVETGDGPPSLFLHAFPLSGFQWRAAVEQLCLFSRCVVPDLLGLGESDAGDQQDLGYRGQARAMVALLDHLGVKRAHLISNGSGTAVAQALLADHPGRVASVLLTNGPTPLQRSSPALARVWELARRKLFVQHQLEPWYENRDFARGADQLGGIGYADSKNPSDEAVEMYLGPLLSSAERRRQAERIALAHAGDAMAGIEPAIGRIAVPARLLWGWAGAGPGAPDATALTQVFEPSRGLRKIENGKLFWPEEQPETIVQEAVQLWRDLGDVA